MAARGPLAVLGGLWNVSQERLCGRPHSRPHARPRVPSTDLGQEHGFPAAGVRLPGFR